MNINPPGEKLEETLVVPQYAKEILCSKHLPGARLCEFLVRIKRGVILEFFKEVNKTSMGSALTILLGFYSTNVEENEVVLGFFADVSSAGGKTMNDIAEDLRRINGVLEVRVSEPAFGGLIIDELFFPLLAGDERSFTFRVDSFGAILKRLYEKFGTGAAVILYEMGISLGESKVKSMMKKHHTDKQTIFKIILAERAAKGWCVAEVNELNSKGATVTVHDLFECLPFKNKQDRPISQIFRGYLTGVFQELYDKRFLVTEVECITKGDAVCRFRIDAAK